MFSVKKISNIAVMASFALITNLSYANPKVVYGTDGRKEVFSASPNLAELARSTAAMIPNDYLQEENGAVSLIDIITLKDRFKLCSTELFINQPTSANCSGFLIAPDTLVTAGHCIQNKYDCSDSQWVFDYKLESPNKVKTNFLSSDVYHCKSIVSQALSDYDNNDYAIIKLDRPVVGRTPLKIRTEGKIDNSANLVVIGNPSGLPTKITEGGKIRNNSKSIYFVASLDTFAGNSGSAVLDANTGLVEGILVRGESDYSSSSQGCSKVKVCSEEGCRGEDVTRITNIVDFI